ncbi:unnamed protein product [Sphenostylis stenocarpa]|uniref:Uncharacterized protein n=1 Tax=Sphenostylis stenocarpa TaxID=92480 RepID=A0AA86W1L6_9FABA|nr:unnamed protein product [Sphenostylis stenocarpa]
MRTLNLKCNGIGEELQNDLHTTTKTKPQVEGRFLLNVIVTRVLSILSHPQAICQQRSISAVGEGWPILELLTGENETLLGWRNFIFVLDLGLDIVNGVGTLNLESDGLSGEGLNEDLYSFFVGIVNSTPLDLSKIREGIPNTVHYIRSYDCEAVILAPS